MAISCVADHYKVWELETESAFRFFGVRYSSAEDGRD